jgi:hypothetical protein
MKVTTSHPFVHVTFEPILAKAWIGALVVTVRETVKKAVPVALALLTASLLTYAMVKFSNALMATTCYSAVCKTASQVFHCGL